MTLLDGVKYMEKTMVIMIGIQGSGKSTFYQKYLADSFVRINLDTLFLV